MFYPAQIIWYCSSCQHTFVQKISYPTPNKCYICGKEAADNYMKAVKEMCAQIKEVDKEFTEGMLDR